MGCSRYDIDGYGVSWVSKSDLKPGVLRKFGIEASQKDIDRVYKHTFMGTVFTSGTDSRGKRHYRHVARFSVSGLKTRLRRN